MTWNTQINTQINIFQNYNQFSPLNLGPQFGRDPFGFQPFPSFNSFHQDFAQNFMMGLFQALAPRLNTGSFLSGQVGFQQFGSGSRVDQLVQEHGNDWDAISRELHDWNWGSRDRQRVRDTVTALRNTSGPEATVGGEAGLGGNKITLPPEIANQMTQARSDDAAEQILRGYLAEQAGSSDSRNILNKVFDANIRSGTEKNASSDLVLDTIVEQSVQTVRSGRMLDWAGCPTHCIPGYNVPLQLNFNDQDYQTAIGKTAELYSPLALDFDGDGKFTSNQTVNFDIDGDGSMEKVNDIDQGDLLLRFDADGDGVSGENGAELLGDNSDLSRFGINQKFENGYDALYALAARFNLVGGSDTTLSQADLQVLEERAGLTVSAGGLNGASQSAQAAGLASIDLGQMGQIQMRHNFDGNGNALMTQTGAGFTAADGRTGTMADIWFRDHNAG